MVICSLILRLQSGHPPLPSRHCAARAFSFTSFAPLTSSKSFTIRTSETPLLQLLYNPHLQTPLGSAGNKGLITPLESALTRNSPVSLLESALAERWGVGGTMMPPLKKKFNFPAPHYSQGRKGIRITPCGRRRCWIAQNHRQNAGKKDPFRELSG